MRPRSGPGALPAPGRPAAGAGQRHHQVHFAGIEQLRDRAEDPGAGQALQAHVDQLVLSFVEIAATPAAPHKRVSQGIFHK